MRVKARAIAKRLKDAVVARVFIWRLVGPKAHRIVEIIRAKK